jgi:hypothetical protein
MMLSCRMTANSLELTAAAEMVARMRNRRRPETFVYVEGAIFGTAYAHVGLDVAGEVVAMTGEVLGRMRYRPRRWSTLQERRQKSTPTSFFRFLVRSRQISSGACQVRYNLIAFIISCKVVILLSRKVANSLG